MQRVFLASSLALLGLAAVPAQAMPIAPLGAFQSDLTLVAQGCGPGFYRGPYGNCRPMGYGAPGAVYGYHPYAHPYYHPYAHRYYHPYAHRYYHPYAHPY